MSARCAPARKAAARAPSCFAANASKSARRLHGSLAIACSRFGDTDLSLLSYSQRKNLRCELRLREEEPELLLELPLRLFFFLFFFWAFREPESTSPRGVAA